MGRRKENCQATEILYLENGAFFAFKSQIRILKKYKVTSFIII